MNRRPRSDDRKFFLNHSRGAVTLAAAGLLGLGSCGGERPTIDEALASALLSGLRARPASPLSTGVAEGFDLAHGRLTPKFPASSEKATALVSLPSRSTAPLHLEDAATGAGVDVSLREARESVGRTVEGTVVYAHAHASGATLIYRPVPEGTEDFLSFDTKPASPSVTYDVTPGKGINGLRLVDGTLEMLGANGAPRLRVAPPYLVGADGGRTDATLTVEGCAVDTDPAAPWGRAVTAPGADTCRVHISWDDSQISYPAILDPRWTTTGTMTVARQDHTATLLSTGKVLVVGGRSTSTGTTGLASAELYDRTTGTWAATGSMTGGRYLHSGTQLGSTSSSTTSGKVLIVGGTNAGSSVSTAQLYSPSAGTWVAATNLNAARHGQTATLLSNGNVLVAGGLSGTTVLNTAAVYNPSSGAGTWTATGNMPQAVKFHTATLLQVSGNSTLNNKVLVAGGNSGSASVASVQLFDGTSSWSSLTALSSTREGHSATTLSNGNVLVTGGRSGSTTLNTTSLFNAATGSGSWASAGTMTSARQLHTATLLPSAIVKNGQVLVAGGSSGTSTLSSTELWNGTSTWTATTAMGTPVQGQTATLLSNNMVLIAGGANGTTTVATAALYDGSFALSCTSNSQCATGFCVSGVCCDTACSGGCGACSLAGKVGTCSAVTSGTVCRAQNGACDVAEVCNGTALTCPVDGFSPSTTVCRASAGPCDVAEKCTGTGTACPTDGFQPSTFVCRASTGACDLAGNCSGSSVSCPADSKAPDGTACDDGNPSTDTDLCKAGACVGAANPVNVLSFDSLDRWSFSYAGSVVRLNGNHTEGTSSLEVAVQNYAPLVSAPMASLGGIGPLALLDVLLPTQQGNPYWFGTVQMFANAPSVGINNAYLGQVELTGLPLATWQTIPFQLTSDLVTRLSGTYSDLTFTIALNVPVNETGHYLLDNLRFIQAITPVLEGTAPDSNGVTKAIFTYQMGGTTPATIPYGPSNFLSDDNGPISGPAEPPPVQFAPTPPVYFVTALTGASLTWTVGGQSATATAAATPLQTQTLPDGTRVAILPGGVQVPLDIAFAPTLDGSIVPSDTSYTSSDITRDNFLQFLNQPKIGPTSAGTLPGSFKVPPDGSSDYVIPIDVPPGRNGVQPSLSLAYNSRNGNSILGPGWVLHGLHKIERCKRTFGMGLERNQDPAGINYTADDTLCLDGEQLVAVAPGEYRTKRDQQAKIVVTSSQSDGPLSFSVYRKDGTIEFYGSDDGSRGFRNHITSIGGTTPGQTALSFTRVIREWLLSKTIDRFGNTMTVSYRFDPIIFTGAPILSDVGPGSPNTITYTSNPTSGRAATKSLKFNYSIIPGQQSAKLENGVLVSGGNALLTGIDITAPNPIRASLVTSYKLTYSIPSITGRRLLSRVQRCDGAGVCMAPTLVSWSQGSYAFRHVVSTVDDFYCSTCQQLDSCSTDALVHSRELVAGDVNGDGRADLIYRPAITTSNYCTQTPQPSTALKVRLGGPNGFGPPLDMGLPDASSEEIAHGVYPAPLTFDIDGDGKEDLLLADNREILAVPFQVAWRPFHSNGDGTFSRLPAGLTDAQYSDPAFNTEELAPMTFYGNVVPADLNGDGLVDIARQMLTAPLGPDAVFDDIAAMGARINLGGTLGDYSTMPFPAPWILFQPGQHSGHGLSGPWPRFSFEADIDGDGRTEVVMTSDPGLPSYGVRFGTGGYSALTTNIPSDPSAYATIDVNGDGLIDIIRHVNSSPSDNSGVESETIWINTGNGFLPYKTLTDPVVQNLPTAFGGFPAAPEFVQDMNGDGIDDIFVPTCSGDGSGDPAQVRIGDGFGNYSQVFLGNVPPALLLTDTQLLHSQNCPVALMDVDGDGQKDIVQIQAGSDVVHIYYRQDPRPDRVVGIINGVRDQISVEYGTHTPTEACQYPNMCTHRNVEVVTGYTVSEGQVVAGQAPTTHYSLLYSTPVGDPTGAGFLGFTSFTRTNDRTGVSETRQYDLTTRQGSWTPFVGEPTTESVSIPLTATGRRLTRLRNTVYESSPSNPTDQFGPFLVRTGTVVDREIEQAPGEQYDPNNAQRWTQEFFTYDALGNVHTQTTNSITDGTTDVKTFDTANDADKWLIGKVNSITELSTAANGETDQRVVTFDVDQDTGAVKSRTSQATDDVTSQLTVTFGRNADGLVQNMTETPYGDAPRTTVIGYDPIDGTLPAAYTNTLKQVTTVAYHSGLGVLVSVTDVNNVSTSWSFDGFGRIRGMSDETGLSTANHYSRPDSSEGLIVGWTESTGRAGSVTYDALGRATASSESAFDGVHSLNVNRLFDAGSGRVGLMSRPYGAVGDSMSAVTTYSYDEAGRLVSEVPPAESERTTVYEGLKTTEYVAGVEKGYRVEDGLSRVVRAVNIEPTSTAPNQEIATTYDYGPFGTLRHVTQPGGGVVTLSYDHLGQRIQLDDPDAGTRISHRNPFGEVVREELAGQSDVIFGRDSLGRATSIIQGTASDLFQWDTAAHGVGSLDFETSSTGVTTSYAYQSNGQVDSTTWIVGGIPFSFNWSYDASGRLQGITYPDVGFGSRFGINIGYGGDGRGSTVISAGSMLWQRTGVNDDGQSLTESFGDGLTGLHVADPNTGRTVHLETGSGSLSQRADGSGPTLQNKLQALTYGYYPDGKLGSRRDEVLSGVEGFFYDNVDRVTGWDVFSSGTTVSYGYDDAGNLKSRQAVTPLGTVTSNEAYVYGERGAGPHALTTGPSGQYSYDPSGRQTSRPGQPQLTYARFDLPTQVGNTDGTVVSLGYDAEGLRVAKTAANMERIDLAGLYERRVDNGVTSHVFYIPGDGRIAGQILCDVNGACGAPVFFHPDEWGTPDTVTTLDPVTGTGKVVGRQKRDPFGRPYSVANMSGPDADVSLGFLGQTEDSEVGLVNLNHRLYDASLGRFLSPDPVISNPFSGQAYNRYSYAGNNPLGFVDPTGLDLLPVEIIYEGMSGDLLVMSNDLIQTTEAQGRQDDGWFKENPNNTVKRGANYIIEVDENGKLVKYNYVDSAGTIHVINPYALQQLLDGRQVNGASAQLAPGPFSFGSTSFLARQAPPGPAPSGRSGGGGVRWTNSMGETCMDGYCSTQNGGIYRYPGDINVKDTSDTWVKLPWVTLSIVQGAGELLNLGRAVVAAGARAGAAGAPAAFGALSKAPQYGIKPFGQLQKTLSGTGLQAHHLIEKRFAGVVGQRVRDMLSVAVTPAEHNVFTQAWRSAIPYGPSGTGSATTQWIMDSARQIYADFPAILQALGL